MSERYSMLIGGRWVLGSTSFPVHNPSDVRDVVGDAPCATQQDVHDALEAARTALPAWRDASVLARGAVLEAAARLIEKSEQQLSFLISREIGKLRGEALAEVRKTRDFFAYYAGLARAPWGQLLADGRSWTTVAVRREALGVVALVTPWNDPVLTAARKLCPALLCGNTAILKPAPQAALCALSLARILEEAGIPAGVLNVLTGQGDDVGKWTVSAEGLDGISFTGSTEVGLEISALGGRTNLPVQTEMGGKNTAVVLADADLDLAVRCVSDGAYTQAGQRCTATSRVLVTEDRYDEFVSKLQNRVVSLRTGLAEAPDSEMGPLIEGNHRDVIASAVKNAVLAGASLVCEGAAIDDSVYAHGNFMVPALIADVPLGDEVWTSELFGPVLAVRRTKDLEEAIEAVNGGPYGLSSALFSRDIDAVERFSSAANVGCVAVNLPTAGWDVHVPFGGFKLSGGGSKEQGLAALDFYSRLKTVAVRTRE